MVQTRWKAPKSHVIKFHFDGAFKLGHDHAGWGVLARDLHGNVVAVVAGRTENVADAFHAEVCAAGKVIRFAESLGTLHIVLETDSELLMLTMNRQGADLCPVGVAIDDLKAQLRISFSSYDVISCKRDFNRPAHKLA
jgi:ribonuclease HI